MLYIVTLGMLSGRSAAIRAKKLRGVSAVFFAGFALVAIAAATHVVYLTAAHFELGDAAQNEALRGLFYVIFGPGVLLLMAAFAIVFIQRQRKVLQPVWRVRALRLALIRQKVTDVPLTLSGAVRALVGAEPRARVYSESTTLYDATNEENALLTSSERRLLERTNSGILRHLGVEDELRASPRSSGDGPLDGRVGHRPRGGRCTRRWRPGGRRGPHTEIGPAGTTEGHPHHGRRRTAVDPVAGHRRNADALGVRRLGERCPRASPRRGVLADADDVVERRILESYGDLAGATEGRWTGHTFANAASTGLSYQDVDVPVEDGTRPAWVFRACEGRRWALHLHGIKSSRASALRSVPIAAELGMTSLVPAFYGDVDADAAPGAGDVAQGSTLGVREARDVEAAIAFAVESGAEEIVVFGWSMGATIALLLAESSRFHDRITQLVLIGPA